MALTLEEQKANLARAKQEAASPEEQIKIGSLFYGAGPYIKEAYSNLAYAPQTSPEAGGLMPSMQTPLGIPVPQAGIPSIGLPKSPEEVSPYAGPYASSYAGDFRDITGSFSAGFPGLAYSSQKPYLSTDQFSLDWDKLSQSPITAPQAQNAAQAGKMQSTAMQDAMKAIQEAASRSGKMEKLDGFKADPERQYATEKDAAGNIVKIIPLRKSLKEDPLVTAQAQGWKASGLEGGAGSPFTPNLDKFKAKQTALSQIPSWEQAGSPWAGKTPEEQAQMRSLMRETTGSRANVGKVIGAETTSGAGKDITTTRYTPQIPTSNQADVARASQQRNISVNPEEGGTRGQVIESWQGQPKKKQQTSTN